MPEEKIDTADFMQATINGLEGLDHRAVTVQPGELDAVCNAMEADGYVFYCAPAADERGLRTVYFVRDPQLRIQI